MKDVKVSSPDKREMRRYRYYSELLYIRDGIERRCSDVTQSTDYEIEKIIRKNGKLNGVLL